MGIYTGEYHLNGSSGADYLIGIGTQTVKYRLSGGGGNDVVIADRSAVFIDTATNSSIPNALPLAQGAGFSTLGDVLVSTGSVPHANVVAQGNGTADYYAIYLESGRTLTLDIDFAAGNYGGASFDTVVQVQNAAGTILATNDDGPTNAGDAGSVSPLDSYLTYTAASSGTVYIKVAQFNTGVVPVGSGYLLNVSLVGATATGTVTATGDQLFGDAGNDFLVGGLGYDEIYGGIGDDRALGGAANDKFTGGAGNDYFDGGADQDTAEYWYEATGGVTVSLALQGSAQNTGSAGTDTLVNVENLRGTDFNDTLTGDGGINTLYGELGSDTLSGGAGGDYIFAGTGAGLDTLDGGADYDILYFNEYLDVDVVAGKAKDANGTETKNFSNFERIVNSAGGTYKLGATTVELWLGNTDETVTLGTARAKVDASGGNDTVNVTAVTGTYAINLATGQTSFSGSTGEYLKGFENLVSTGSAQLNVTGTDGDNRIQGGYNADVLNGGAGNDWLFSYLGDDRLIGGDGNDTLVSGFDDDIMEGGAGIDTADFRREGFDGVTVSLAIVGPQNTSHGTDTLTGIENLTGSTYDDTLTGDDNANVIDGLDGDDTLDGGGGDDTLYANYGLDTVDGGSGTDRLVLNNQGWTLDLDAGSGAALGINSIDFTGVEQIDTGSGNDTVTLGHANWTVDLGDGNDTIVVGLGTSRVFAGSGDDTIDLRQLASVNYEIDLDTGITNFSDAGENFFGFNRVLGGNGREIISGSYGDDYISLGLGDDIANGSNGHDTLIGAEGNDTLNGGGGLDTMLGGLGDDTYYVDVEEDAITEAKDGGLDLVYATGNYTLAANLEKLVLSGDFASVGSGNTLANEIRGTDGVNELYGQNGDDSLYGNGGDDYIEGGQGADLLVGGSGRDFLIGGAGRDRLTGGGGSDTFVFNEGDFGTTLNKADIISDFVKGPDAIDLQSVDGDTTTSGLQAFTWIGKAAFSGTAGQLRYEISGGDTIVTGDRNGDAVADLFIRVLGEIALGPNDFRLASNAPPPAAVLIGDQGGAHLGVMPEDISMRSTHAFDAIGHVMLV